MVDVSVHDLCRNFGDFAALKGISFDVNDGEFLTLLGPSGCGKSTTLTAVAGLDRPTSGRITIGGRTVFDGADDIFVDAQFRNIGMMFQSYALWPHLTVYKNLDFPLELRRIRGKEAQKRISEALVLVDMEDYAGRYPAELSGGQQQRVALARTLVFGPGILLLDEPLSNLDAKLRDRARIWLAELQKRTGVTTIYVTHDQSEALALSDRIIVMNQGRIAQIGTPQEIYEQPADVFVADFVGASNLVSGELVERSDSHCCVRLPNGDVLRAPPPAADIGNGAVTLAIRPERIEMTTAANGYGNHVKGEIVAVSYLGSRNLTVLDIGRQQVRVETSVRPSGNNVSLRFPEQAITVFPSSDLNAVVEQ